MNKFLTIMLLAAALPLTATAQNATPIVPAADQNYCAHAFSVTGGLKALADNLCSAGNNMISLLAQYQSSASASSTNPMHSLLGKISLGGSNPAPTSITAATPAQPVPQTPASAAPAPQSTGASSSNPYAYS